MSFYHSEIHSSNSTTWEDLIADSNTNMNVHTRRRTVSDPGHLPYEAEDVEDSMSLDDYSPASPSSIISCPNFDVRTPGSNSKDIDSVSNDDGIEPIRMYSVDGSSTAYDAPLYYEHDFLGMNDGFYPPFFADQNEMPMPGDPRFFGPGMFDPGMVFAPPLPQPHFEGMDDYVDYEQGFAPVLDGPEPVFGARYRQMHRELFEFEHPVYPEYPEDLEYLDLPDEQSQRDDEEYVVFGLDDPSEQTPFGEALYHQQEPYYAYERRQVANPIPVDYHYPDAAEFYQAEPQLQQEEAQHDGVQAFLAEEFQRQEQQYYEDGVQEFLQYQRQQQALAQPEDGTHNPIETWLNTISSPPRGTPERPAELPTNLEPEIHMIRLQGQRTPSPRSQMARLPLLLRTRRFDVSEEDLRLTT